MKSRMWMIYLILLILIPGGSMYLNRQAAVDARNLVANIPTRGEIEIVDKVALSGRLAGKSHEVKSFGAILIKTDKSEKTLQNYYGKNRKIYVQKQDNAVISQITNKKVKFKKYEESDNMYIVYVWGTPKLSLAKKLDIRAWTPNKDTIDKLLSVQ